MNKGISLVEVLVSLFIIAIIVGPFTGMFVQSTRVRQTTQKQIKGIYAVRNEMEELMAKNLAEAYASNGESMVDGFYLTTSVTSYSTNGNASRFDIIIGTNHELDDEFSILTPEGISSIKIKDTGRPVPIIIELEESLFYINIDGQVIEGVIEDQSIADLYINLTGKSSNNLLQFTVKGDTNIRVYPGDDEDWWISHSEDYLAIDKCTYRDYSLLKARIEAFDDADTDRSLFKIENIIRVKN